MGSRRIGRRVVVGGLLAAAVIPIAANSSAFADDASESSTFDPLFHAFFGFQRDALEPTTVYSVSGEPPFFQSIHQTEFFGTDATGTLPAGEFQVDNEVITDPFGPASAELLVTNSEAGTTAPPVGSVCDALHLGNGLENFYSDIASATPGGPDTLTDTLVTPLGGIPLMTDFHAFLSPMDLFFPY